ncbi:UNVERIFIED_ORG: hypothetical protein ABRZ91_000922 [Heyndrickxia coagulans]
MLRKQEKTKAFLNLELVYVKKAGKIDGLP